MLLIPNDTQLLSKFNGYTYARETRQIQFDLINITMCRLL